ncbi:hypothetical protein [Thalassospira tepidiphila]|uniref:hypothetical protein n=1 Tax=Thalassospira tepidiphila TaxID=393657 RepID=UPI003AA9DA39
MENFSKEKYSLIINEVRERIFSAEILAEQKNKVFIESTSLQIRKILELVAYLSVLVNTEKLNYKERTEYHAGRIVDSLIEKTTIFYPLPSYMIHPKEKDEQPTLIPLGYKHALSQKDFRENYKLCGKVLHAQHPLKPESNIEEIYRKNKETLNKIKGLLKSHTIGIKREKQKYTFLHVEIDFSNNENTKDSLIYEYNTHITSEKQLKELFNPQ